MDAADLTVLRMVERDLLHPRAIEAAIKRAVARLRAAPHDYEARRRATADRLDQLDGELARLTSAVAAGAGDLGSVVDATRTREHERGRLRDELTTLGAIPTPPVLDAAALRGTLRARLADWQATLRRQPVEARHVLRPLLQGRLVFTPKADDRGRYYEVTGVGTVRPVLAGVVVANGVVSPTGFAHRGPPSSSMAARPNPAATQDLWGVHDQGRQTSRS
jgi:hypothetical protein